MTFPWGAGLKTDLKQPSVRQFFNIPAKTIHEDNRMTSGQSALTGAEAGSGRSLCKLLAENVDG